MMLWLAGAAKSLACLFVGGWGYLFGFDGGILSDQCFATTTVSTDPSYYTVPFKAFEYYAIAHIISADVNAYIYFGQL
jgi:hypothetical protein